MVDLGRDVVQLDFDRILLVIGESEVVLLIAETDDFLGQRLTALGALLPDFAQGNVDAHFLAFVFDELQFGLGIGHEGIDRDDDRKLVDILDIGDMTEQVRQTSFEGFKIFGTEFSLRDTAVIFQSTDGRDDDDCARFETGIAALDVEEFLCAEVSTEACLGNCVIT